MSHQRRPYRQDIGTDSSDESDDRGHVSSRPGNNTREANASRVTEERAVSINDVLKKALERAADPGVGDEEPEVLKDPPHESRGISLTDDEKARREIEAAKLKQLYEEEMRVAAMTFDANAIIRVSENMRERSKYIPLRLTYEERKTLRLVNASINVSDYTNVVDIPFKNKAKRQHIQLQQVVAFLSGLIAAVDYTKGQEVIASINPSIFRANCSHALIIVILQVLVDRNFQPHEEAIQDMLEIARRYKITNPEKMRSEYGKLIYLIQDAESDEIKPLLGIDIHRPIKTVYSFLEEVNGLHMLDDEHIGTATQGLNHV